MTGTVGDESLNLEAVCKVISQEDFLRFQQVIKSYDEQDKSCAFSHCCPAKIFDQHMTIADAAGQGYLSVLKYMRAKGYSYTFNTMARACVMGHFEVVKFLHEDGAPRNEALDWAARMGHFDLTVWLLRQGYGCSTWAMTGAAEDGNLEMVKFLHVMGKEPNVRALACAASRGHLEVVKYLYENFCIDGWVQHGLSEARTNLEVSENPRPDIQACVSYLEKKLPIGTLTISGGLALDARA